MVLDVIAGAVLLTSPWLFGYRPQLSSFQSGVHVISGLVVFGFVAFTNRGQVSVEEKKEREFPRAA